MVGVELNNNNNNNKQVEFMIDVSITHKKIIILISLVGLDPFTV